MQTSCFKDLLAGHWNLLLAARIRRNPRQVRIREDENVGDVNDEKATRFEDVAVKLNHFLKQGLPIGKGKILFVGFANEVRRRPETQGNRIWFDLPQKVSCIPFVDSTDTEEAQCLGRSKWRSSPRLRTIAPSAGISRWL